MTGKGPNGGDTPAFATPQDAVKASLALPPDEIIAELKATRAYGPKCNFLLE